MKYTVYEIKNIITNKVYIGSSRKFKHRISTHFSNLKKGIHHCEYLQRSYNKYGKENFVYKILFLFDNEKEMFQKEEELLQDLSNKYNTTNKVCGGDLITNHPRLNEIKIKHRENYKKLIENNDGIHPSKINIRFNGENNPNYKHGKSIDNKKCIHCNLKISVGAIQCENCYFKFRNISGINNPFYGKKHSRETILKIKETKNKYPQPLPSNTLRILIDEIEYESASKASKVFNCSVATILNRCRSNKFPNYQIITEAVI